jgi:hypothetical protein
MTLTKKNKLFRTYWQEYKIENKSHENRVRKPTVREERKRGPRLEGAQNTTRVI